MPKSQKQTSLPEKDYLAILDTIKSFNQCNTRNDLKAVFKNQLMPLFEMQSGIYAWSSPEFHSAGVIDKIGFPDNEIGVFLETGKTSSFNKSMMEQARSVFAVDVDISRKIIEKDCKLFFKNNPQLRRDDYPFINSIKSGLVAGDLPEPTLAVALYRINDCKKVCTLRDIRVMELIRPHLFQIIKTICLNEEVAQYKSLSEKLADCSSPIALIRMDMLVVFLNQAFKDLLKIERGQRLPKEMVELIKKESVKYDSPYETEHGAIELSFYIAHKKKFRLSVTLLEGRGVEEDKRWLIRLKPAVEPYSKMNLIMQKASLTGREMETTVLVKDGMSNQEIAGRLFISLETVKSHLQKIFQKMDVPSRTKLITVLNG